MGSEIQCQTEVEATTPVTEPERPHVWTDEEKVEYLADRDWSISRIARKTGLSADRIRKLIEDVDERRFADLEASPRRRKAQYVATNKAIAATAWDRVERGGNARLLKLVLEAQNQSIKVLGDYAPTQTVNVEWKAHALVNPEVHARIMADPVAREALIRLEEFASGQQADVEVTPRSTAEGGGD